MQKLNFLVCTIYYCAIETFDIFYFNMSNSMLLSMTPKFSVFLLEIFSLQLMQVSLVVCSLECLANCNRGVLLFAVFIMHTFKLFRYLLGCVLDRYDYPFSFFVCVYVCITAFILV